MNTSQPVKGRNRFPFITIIIGVMALGMLLAAGGFSFAASQEGRDSFCASCHSQPETTYYQRSIDSQAVDLASFHTPQNTRCIDCHSGPGIFGRMQAEILGARNAAMWYTGSAVQPARLYFPIQDANCLKCHQDVTQRNFVPKQTVTIPGIERGGGEGEGEGRNNHWHAFMSRWQASDPNAGSCVTCHPGHSTSAAVQTGFQDTQTTRNTCDACHKVLRREGGGD